MSYDETPLHNGQKCDLLQQQLLFLSFLLYDVLVDGFVESWINVGDGRGGGGEWLVGYYY